MLFCVYNLFNYKVPTVYTYVAVSSHYCIIPHLAS